MLEKLPYYHVIVPYMAIFLVTLLARGRSRPVYLGSIAAMIAWCVAFLVFDPATIHFNIFYALTFLSFAFALEYGGKSEREAAVMAYVLMIIPYFAAIYEPGTNKEFDPLGAAIDVAFMVWLGTIAHRYDRFWAYFASACFSLAVVGHLAVYLTAEFHSEAYLRMRFAPGGMFIFLLAGAVVANIRRTRKSIAPVVSLAKSPRPLEA